MAGPQTYAFDNARQVQEQRLRALEAALDAGTIRHLEAAGVGPGWRIVPASSAASRARSRCSCTCRALSNAYV